MRRPEEKTSDLYGSFSDNMNEKKTTREPVPPEERKTKKKQLSEDAFKYLKGGKLPTIFRTDADDAYDLQVALHKDRFFGGYAISPQRKRQPE